MGGSVTDYCSTARVDFDVHAALAGRALGRGLWVAPDALSHHMITLGHETQHLDLFCDCLA